jgi:PIN domain
MSDKVVYLVPDTNVFEQCVPLTNTDWSAWSDYEDVHILVTRPVVREIDQHKNRGSDRISDKARKASALFNEILDGGELSKVIREVRPRVTLHLRQDVKATPGLDERLNYEVFDDNLVGCAHALSKEFSPCYLLSSDAGPKASAVMVQLAFKVPPKTWQLSPENDEREKEIARLKQEVARYKKAEPQFDMKFVAAEGRAVGELSGEVKQFVPLTEDEIDEAMSLLQMWHPKVKDFRRSQPHPHYLAALSGIGDTYIPATEAEIAEYVEKSYPAWLESCRIRFAQLHEILQRSVKAPEFIWQLQNNGTRPADDALVTFEARGSFAVQPPPQPIEDDDDKPVIPELLPRPPQAPRGTSRNIYKDAFGLGSMGDIDKMGEVMTLINMKPPRIAPPNKNAFYLFDSKSGPTRSFALKCQQWRHGGEAEHFSGQLCWSDDISEFSGDLVCRIMAANASDVSERSIKVRMAVQRVRTINEIERIIKSLR